jgi:hypothetical protein
VICGEKYYQGRRYFRYRVYRKYFKTFHLTNTTQKYDIFPWRWNFLKSKLKENPDYHYNMSLWSNCER